MRISLQNHGLLYKQAWLATRAYTRPRVPPAARRPQCQWCIQSDLYVQYTAFKASKIEKAKTTISEHRFSEVAVAAPAGRARDGRDPPQTVRSWHVGRVPVHRAGRAQKNREKNETSRRSAAERLQAEVRIMMSSDKTLQVHHGDVILGLVRGGILVP